MFIACWSAKGGVGTTVVAAGLALATRTANRAAPSLLVDLDGDLPCCLGLPDPEGPGVAEWAASGPEVPPDALSRLEVPVTTGLALLPRGHGPLLPDRIDLLVSLLIASGRRVVVDCGALGPPQARRARVDSSRAGGERQHGPVAGAEPEGSVDRRVQAAARVVAAAPSSLLVVRPCVMGLHRSSRLGLRPSGVVVIREPGRALRAADVEAVVGAPVLAELALDPAVARAVDAGLLGARLPRGFADALAAVA